MESISNDNANISLSIIINYTQTIDLMDYGTLSNKNKIKKTTEKLRHVRSTQMLQQKVIQQQVRFQNQLWKSPRAKQTVYEAIWEFLGAFAPKMVGNSFPYSILQKNLASRSSVKIDTCELRCESL